MTSTTAPLLDRLPDAAAGASPDPDALYEAFSGWAEDQGLALYPHQDEALIEIVSGAHVILATPTGSGKSLVATGAHFAALAANRAGTGGRTYYTAPLKALVSEKFFALIELFGTANVGMMTGDSRGQRRRPDHLLHRRDPREPGPARWRRHRRLARGDGRVPLLRGSAARLGVAGAAARAAERAVRAHVGHAGRHLVAGRGPPASRHPRHRRGHHDRAPRAARLRIRRSSRCPR